MSNILILSIPANPSSHINIIKFDLYTQCYLRFPFQCSSIHFFPRIRRKVCRKKNLFSQCVYFMMINCGVFVKATRFYCVVVCMDIHYTMWKNINKNSTMWWYNIKHNNLSIFFFLYHFFSSAVYIGNKKKNKIKTHPTRNWFINLWNSRVFWG